jgi:carbohydrate kinase (thermoresistant glucokinase family)|tara:strand:+ start:4873 stop:5349 length:477 start_codon:yes stop_codon:yes gene_type:complete
MGVSGCGKSTIAVQLHARLPQQYLDADDFHPQENKQKISSGIPLTDDDRQPWLTKVNAAVKASENKQGVILACSALKHQYRETLMQGLAWPMHIIWLHGDKNTLLDRLEQRQGHFAKANILDSQIATLQPPDVQPFDIAESAEQIVEKILQTLGHKSN